MGSSPIRSCAAHGAPTLVQRPSIGNRPGALVDWGVLDQYVDQQLPGALRGRVAEQGQRVTCEAKQGTGDGRVMRWRVPRQEGRRQNAQARRLQVISCWNAVKQAVMPIALQSELPLDKGLGTEKRSQDYEFVLLPGPWSVEE